MKTLKSHQFKLVALKNLKIEVAELHIRESQKRGILDLIEQVRGKAISFGFTKDFVTKIGFVATLIKRLKDG